MTRSSGRRPGVTLVEVLVVAAVGAVLAGLTAAGVQKVRAAAMATGCRNNLRQLGLAAHAYHGSAGTFPPGLRTPDTPDPYPYLGWAARLLPWLDDGPRWAAIQQAFRADRDFLRRPHRAGRAAVVRAFVCPADPLAAVPHPTYRVAFASYLGVAGRNQFADDGVLFANSRVAAADVTDGLSQTLLAGERGVTADGRLGWWYAGWGQGKNGSAEVVLGVAEVWTYAPYLAVCPPGPYGYGPGRADDPCAALWFWGHHPGGGHFLLADGSVRLVPYSAAAVLPALATRRGGEAVGW